MFSFQTVSYKETFKTIHVGYIQHAIYSQINIAKYIFHIKRFVILNILNS